MIGKSGDGLKVCMKAISEVGQVAWPLLAWSIKARLRPAPFANERILYGSHFRLQGVNLSRNMYLLQRRYAAVIRPLL